MNGVWGEWGEWDECSVPCGSGEHTRARACDSPAPANGGDDCTVDGSSKTETKNCNQNPCSSKQFNNVGKIAVCMNETAFYDYIKA